MMNRKKMKTQKASKEAKDLKEAEQKAIDIIKNLPINKKPTGPVNSSQKK